SAIFGGFGEAEKTQVTHFFEQRMRGANAGFLPLIDMRIDLGGDEFLQAAAQLLMLGREQHWRFLFFSCSFYCSGQTITRARDLTEWFGACVTPPGGRWRDKGLRLCGCRGDRSGRRPTAERSHKAPWIRRPRA